MIDPAKTEERIRRAFAESASAKEGFLETEMSALISVVDLVAERFRDGRKLLFFGNGGSAADAQHLAAEFVNRFQIERRPLPAIALTTDSSILTSIGNDYGYDDVFAKQVEALGQPGDVAIAISTSGSSESVLRAVEEASRRGVTTVGVTGGKGGRLGEIADRVLRVGSTTVVARIQETHILIGHVLCELVDEALFGDGSGGGG